jgi:hypothetical protein
MRARYKAMLDENGEGQKNADGSDKTTMWLDCTGSSNCEDLGGDVMELSALQDMARVADGNMTAFMNHRYELPGQVFGSIKSAGLRERMADDGKRYIDLDLGIAVQELNPAAVQTFKMIENGTKLGISIGCMVDEAEYVEVKDHPNGGYFSIKRVTPLEFSIVGIPANQRSWAHYAAKALRKRGRTAAEKAAGVAILDTAPVQMPSQWLASSTTNAMPNVTDYGSPAPRLPSFPDTQMKVGVPSQETPGQGSPENGGAPTRTVIEAPAGPPMDAGVTAAATSPEDDARAIAAIEAMELRVAASALARSMESAQPLLDATREQLAAASAVLEDVRAETADLLKSQSAVKAELDALQQRIGEAKAISLGRATATAPVTGVRGKLTPSLLMRSNPLDLARAIREETEQERDALAANA